MAINITADMVRNYIETDLNSTPRHDCSSLADALNEVSAEIDHDVVELMWLVLENKPIDSLHTHSYTFHTANGREIINRVKDYYYEHESAS